MIMEKSLSDRIARFLAIEKPTDDQIREAALMLLQCDPKRARGIYNTAQKRPASMLAWIRTDLRKHLGIAQRGLKREDVEQYNSETLKKVRETLQYAPEGVEVKQEKGDIPVLGVRGKREDHDALPEKIQQLWDSNKTHWQQARKLHAQLALMIERPDYAPCDGNEACYQLRQLDDSVRKAYERYDAYEMPKDGAPDGDSVDDFTDRVKTISAARTAISRALGRKEQTAESMEALRTAVQTLKDLKQGFKPQTAEKLRLLGIDI